MCYNEHRDERSVFMQRNTEWDEKAGRYLLTNPDLTHPSVNELIQIIGYLEDLQEEEEKEKLIYGW